MNQNAPRPMPFAVMRNAHEAMRASISLQAQALESENLESFREEWEQYSKALAVHMAMEDNSMFDLLDEVGDGAISAAGLPDEHKEDSRLAHAVQAAIGEADTSAILSAWSTWKEDHLNHLSHEEKVMMPLVMKTAGSPAELARVVHDRLISTSEDLPNFDWYIGWVVKMLSEHGSTDQPPNVATRVFAWALQHVCTPTQWARLRPVVKQNCSPEIWAEMTSQFGLDEEGKIESGNAQEGGLLNAIKRLFKNAG